MESEGVVTSDVRARTSTLVRARHPALVGDVAAAIAAAGRGVEGEQSRGCAELLLRLFEAGIAAGRLDPQSATMRDLARSAPPLSTRQLVDAVHVAEAVILDEVALDAQLGATSEPWAAVAHVIRRATLEILGAHAEQSGGRDPRRLRDPLTTLLASDVFDLALSQEIERALRHEHALALLLFEIDDLSRIGREHGPGVGDRLLERTGILARRFFRTHDWVARRDADAIAVLLPETTLDQAVELAGRFRDTVRQRLVLTDHNTEARHAVTLSAAAVGCDRVQSGLDAARVMAEAEAAVARGRHNGRPVERVALLPTSLTIIGAAAMLGLAPHAVGALVRTGALKATRRGRHYHIDHDVLDSYRKSTRQAPRRA